MLGHPIVSLRAGTGPEEIAGCSPAGMQPGRRRSASRPGCRRGCPHPWCWLRRASPSAWQPDRPAGRACAPPGSAPRDPIPVAPAQPAAGPGFPWVSCRAGGRFEHLHRLDQALLHAVEGLREDVDLVVAPDLEVGHVDVLALGELVREP